MCYLNKIWFGFFFNLIQHAFFTSRIKLVNKATSKKKIIKTLCDAVKHTRFPKEDHLPD